MGSLLLRDKILHARGDSSEGMMKMIVHDGTRGTVLYIGILSLHCALLTENGKA